MATEPRLDLPYIATAQAQKETVYNEAILTLGRLVQTSVLGVQNDDPQVLSPSPTEGDGWIVMGSSPATSGDFVDHENDLAFWNGTDWEFITPDAGFLVYVISARAYWAFDGTNWVSALALP
jgi:hypothetical protein